jgi:hypothetical protein
MNTPVARLLPWWRERIFMADETPPPYEPPLADGAPDRLKFFIYYLTRDFVPLGVVDYAMQRARDMPETPPPGPARDYADRISRELMYKPTPVQE